MDLERKRIKAEIRENDDIHSLDFYADRLIWEDSPLSMPIAGIPSTLNHIYKKDLEAARRQIFSIGRIHFYLTGSVSDKDISYLCRLIEKVSFPVWKGNADNCTPIPASFGRREPSLFIKQARYYYVRISFDLSAGGGQNAALDYLYDLLFLGDSCLAYSKLSEEQGYIYSFDPCLEKYGNAGCLTLSFCVSGTHFLPAVRTALSIFVSLRQELPDLSRVRPTYTDNSLMLLDQPEQLNWIGGYENHILGVSDSSLADRKARYEAVTPKQVQILASRIFRKNNLSLAVKSAGRSVTSALLRKLIEESGL